MNRTLWIITALGVFLAGCGTNEAQVEDAAHSEQAAEGEAGEENHTEGEVRLDPDQEVTAGIEVQSVAMRLVQQTLEVPGVVTSTTKGRAVVTPPVNGRVVAISVALGDQVRQGQTLAVIESVELAQTWSSIADAERNRDAMLAALREAKSEVDLDLAKQAAAKVRLARQRELVQAGAFGQAPLQQATSELNEAQSAVLSAQTELASHAEVVRRLENLFRDGIVSKAELEAARLELQQDQIQHDLAIARAANARTTYDREKRIADGGLLNAKELQSAEAEVGAAELEVERARIRYRSAQAAVVNSERAVANARSVYLSNSAGGSASVGRVSLAAPISGRVTHLDVTKGQAVDRTQVLMEVENLASVWVTASVPEQDASKVRKGATATIVAAGLAGREFQGVVQVVGDRVDSRTRAIPVQCLVTSNGELKPNMFASVRLAYGEGRRVLAVPNSAILKEDNRVYVFVKHEDAYAKTEIVSGAGADGFVEVTAGLNAGDRVAVKGGFVLNSQLRKGELQGHDH